MKISKWFAMMALALVATMGLAACGDDEETACTTNADCAEGRACFDGLCKIECTTDSECNEGQVCGSRGFCEEAGAACADDRDCATGETCDTATGTCFTSECTRDTDCGSGEVCVDGQCTEEGGQCTPQTQAADCSSVDGYCAQTGECVDFSCGSQFNNCDRCGAGPNGGKRSSGGPVIFLPELVNCSRNVSATTCQEDAPFLCEWTFLGYGVDGTIPAQNELKDKVFLIRNNSGDRVKVFGVKRADDAPNVKINFQTCFGQSPSSSFTSGVVIQDNGNRFSNSLCISG